MFIDTHTHLDLEHFPDVGDVIDEASGLGVRALINIGFDPVRWSSTLALVEQFSGVTCALGFHPGSTDLFSNDSADELVALIEREQPVAIGEAGIDLFWENNPSLATQQAVFAFQIDLALRFDLPLVIHQRNAEREVREQLETADRDLRVVLHSFDGTDELFDLALERGWYLGVGGLMTRRSATVRELLARVPLDRFVLETDSPYLVPAGIKNRRNSPSNIPVIAERFAGVRGVDVDVVQEAAWRNSLAAFPGINAVTTLQATAR